MAENDFTPPPEDHELWQELERHTRRKPRPPKPEHPPGAQTAPSLQSLLDGEPVIRQIDLAEYIDLEHSYQVAKGDLESVRDQIIESLVAGCAVEPGPYTVTLSDDRTQALIAPAKKER